MDRQGVTVEDAAGKRRTRTSSGRQAGAGTAAGMTGAPDYLLLVIVSFLCVFGLLMVYSSSPSDARDIGQDSAYFFLRQGRSLLLGALALVAGMNIPYLKWRDRAPLVFVGAVGLLILVLFIGEGEGGARRWLFTQWFQPSEVAKLAVIMFVAWWLPRKRDDVGTLSYGLIPFGILVGAVAALILREPDLGTTGIVLLTAFMMYVMAGANLVQMAGASVLGALVLVATAQPYQSERFRGFLWPCEPENFERLRQICEGTIGLGSGGLFGLGLGNSRMRWVLALPYSDSIYSTIGEELGLLGTAAIVVLFCVLVYRGLRIAFEVEDPFAQLMAAGISFWLGVQACINMGGNVALLPLTGVPLPFISFGGSSLVTTMFGVGVLLNISRYRRIAVAGDGLQPQRKTHASGSDGGRHSRTRVSGAGGARRPKTSAAGE